jgi:hypothetical protein
VPFLDIHDNVDHSAIVLGGYHLEGRPELSFMVSVVGPSATQYYLSVVLLGNSSCLQLQFWLLLIGTEGAGIVSAPTFSISLLKKTIP